MHSREDAIVAAARACVGARFRSQGRGRDTGLDCVGVALIAAMAAGVRFDVPCYALGGDHEAQLDAALGRVCTLVGSAVPGDLMVTAPAPNRRHLGIVTPAGLVHAHAGLGRVVEGPLDPAWAVIAAWRFPEPEE